MREVKRGKAAAPAGLNKKDKLGKTELQRAREHFNKATTTGIKAATFDFSAYRSPDVKERLAKLFYRKCAYCESAYDYQSPVDVEHYRPKGKVEGSKHSGYWWLGSDWTNLLPSCIDCNRRRKQNTPQVSASLTVLYKKFKSGKKDSFPIAGTYALAENTDFKGEKPLLLDPTRDNPDMHLIFCIGEGDLMGLVYPASMGYDSGAVIPLIDDNAQLVARHAAAQGRSEKGAVSIQCYGLNRLGLVQQRAKVVQQLRFLESVLIDVVSIREDLENLNKRLNQTEILKAVGKLESLKNRIIAQMRSYAEPTAPYSAIAKTYLRDFVARIT